MNLFVARPGFSAVSGRHWLCAALAVFSLGVLSACDSSRPAASTVDIGNIGKGVGDVPLRPDFSGPLTGDAIEVLSSRADLVSGDDVLVRITPPAGTSLLSVRTSLNGTDISPRFSMATDGSLTGLVDGLTLGQNLIAADYPGGGSRYVVINHPNGGPVIAGAQVQPWTCPQGALDVQCNQPAVYGYLYISSSPAKSGFQTYDPENPASDVASTTTDQGVTVPFIVRVETGYQDRDQYRIAALYQPGKPWTAAAPQPQFNHKLLITHGALCGAAYAAGSAPSVTSYAAPFGLVAGLPLSTGPDSTQYALGAGFVVMATALNNSGHNCGVTTQAESLIMAKERVIEQYGPLRYTIGSGCSGGSLAAQWIANAYPGIYQGILPTCSFPDAWSTASQIVDYHLLVNYFGTLTVGGKARVPWTPAQVAAVEGNSLPVDAVFHDVGFVPNFIPSSVCPGVDASIVYNADSRPGGVRCTPVDQAVNVFGIRAATVWGVAEKKRGQGFAGFAADNVGVQYGLLALQQGLITPMMFLDLNSKIGGLDIDLNFVPARLVADTPALANAYRSGMINEANNLGSTAIIDCRGPDPGAGHDAYRAFAVRARLDRALGTHANQLIWEGPALIFGDNRCNLNSLLAMDRWLAAVERDPAALPLAQKLVADKPADLGDACFDGIGNQLSSGLCSSAVVPINGTPRTAAGDAITTDANKCRLKSLDRADDYGPLPFTDAEWATMQSLFPEGVCDFGQLGVDQQPTIPWQTYQSIDGAVIVGGTPLPVTALRSATGWAAAAFGGR